MRKKSYISASVLLAVLLLLPVCKTEGQNIAVKSDLLTGMLSSPNLGVERTNAGSTGLYSRNCVIGCASPMAGISSG